MDRTKFTVIIPTRERCDTLKSSLKTCVQQDYDNLQIIVSDNASQDQTREVVDSYKDSRIRYVNPGRRLSMSHNWEFALSHVSDGYVIIMGDDDGLLPEAIRDLNVLTHDTGALAVNWIHGFYGWPNSSYAWIRNRLKLPIGKGIHWVDSKATLMDVLSFRKNYSELPMIYPFVIHHDCISRARNSEKHFFNSITPDVYSGIAIAGVLDRYVCADRPFVLSGISSHSSGASFTNATIDKRSTTRFFSEENILFHEKLSLAPSMVILIAEAFFQAKEAVPGLGSVPFDFRRMVKAALRETCRLRPPANEITVEALLNICDKNNLGPAVRNRVLRFRPSIVDKIIPESSLRILFYKALFNLEGTDIQNVYEASVFAKSILDKRNAGHLFFKERLDFLGYQIARTLAPIFKRRSKQWGY